MGGICWSTLFQGLADQAGGAPAVRVTVLKLFLLGSGKGEGGGGGGEGGARGGCEARVAEAAARSGVPLVYRVVCAQPSELHPGMVTVDPDEVVAVVSCWALSIFPGLQSAARQPPQLYAQGNTTLQTLQRRRDGTALSAALSLLPPAADAAGAVTTTLHSPRY